MRELLTDGPCILVSTKLALAIGLQEAIVLTQIHELADAFKRVGDRNHYRDGRWWVWNTYESWQANHFPYRCTKSIERTLIKLREEGLVIATDRYNKKLYDRTLWYTIDYDELKRCLAEGARSGE